MYYVRELIEILLGEEEYVTLHTTEDKEEAVDHAVQAVMFGRDCKVVDDYEEVVWGPAFEEDNDE